MSSKIVKRLKDDAPLADARCQQAIGFRAAAGEDNMGAAIVALGLEAGAVIGDRIEQLLAQLGEMPAHSPQMAPHLPRAQQPLK